ncbi:MAG: hypothetical protein ACK4QW_01900 [Alphaproteobacteria bacterium]
MTPLTREAIARVLGPVDEDVAAQIAATGSSEEELAEASAWVENDEPLVNDYRPFPQGRVAALVEILQSFGEPDEEG